MKKVYLYLLSAICLISCGTSESYEEEIVYESDVSADSLLTLDDTLAYLAKKEGADSEKLIMKFDSITSTINGFVSDFPKFTSAAGIMITQSEDGIIKFYQSPQKNSLKMKIGNNIKNITDLAIFPDSEFLDWCHFGISDIYIVKDAQTQKKAYIIRFWERIEGIGETNSIVVNDTGKIIEEFGYDCYIPDWYEYGEDVNERDGRTYKIDIAKGIRYDPVYDKDPQKCLWSVYQFNGEEFVYQGEISARADTAKGLIFFPADYKNPHSNHWRVYMVNEDKFVNYGDNSQRP